MAPSRPEPGVRVPCAGWTDQAGARQPCASGAEMEIPRWMVKTLRKWSDAQEDHGRARLAEDETAKCAACATRDRIARAVVEMRIAESDQLWLRRLRAGDVVEADIPADVRRRQLSDIRRISSARPASPARAPLTDPRDGTKEK